MLYILFNAQIESSPNIWPTSNFLLRLYSDGTSDLSEITYLSGVTNVQLKSINSSGVIAAIGNASMGDGHALLLVPIDIEATNRDDLTLNWSNAKALSGISAVYAGSTTGDMCGWSLPTSLWPTATFTWTAVGSGGNIITGPTGAGINKWQISDNGNDAAGNVSLAWKPDTYTIKCTVAHSVGHNADLQFNQTVGWRTEDYVVDGQIVTTHGYDAAAPTLAQEPNFRGAIVSDCDILPYGTGPIIAALPVPDTLFAFLEFGNWAIHPHNVTPQGPFDSWIILPLVSVRGAVTEGERYWMLQQGLNASIDIPTAPAQVPYQGLNDISTVAAGGHYRIFHHYQTRFILNQNGKIDLATFHNIHEDACVGDTKLVLPAGAFSPVWNNSEIALTGGSGAPAETNPLYNKQRTTSVDGTQHSSYASGRIGQEGQNGNWRVFGQDAPWIFSEIICQVNSDHSVHSSIKVSVDQTWQDVGAMLGNTHFNNLNIYTATAGEMDQNGQRVISYDWKHDSPLLMEGQLKAFITSVRYGTWPNPPSIPSVR